MEVFEFGRACVMITNRMREAGKDPVRDWKRWFPRIIDQEIEKSEEMYPILGLRTFTAVQQSICKRVWFFFFKNEPLPWAEVNPDRPSFGQEEEMEISLMREALKVSLTDTKAAIAIFGRNSMGTSKTGSEKPVSEVQPTVETPTVSKAPPPPKPDPIPPPVPTISAVPTPKPKQPTSKPEQPKPKPAQPTKPAGPNPDYKPSFGAAGFVPGGVSQFHRMMRPDAGTSDRRWENAAPPQPSDRPEGWTTGPDPIKSNDGVDEAKERLKGLQVEDPVFEAAMAKMVARINELETQLNAEKAQFPRLPSAPLPDLGSCHQMGPLVGFVGSGPAATPTKKCPFDSWLDDDGKPIACLPGCGPGEIPLPDNMDPKVYLLPIKTDLEAWLNVDLYFETKNNKASPNKIQILPGKSRGQPRPAEVDSEYGLRAFNILFRWTQQMIDEGEMKPIIPFVKEYLTMESQFFGTRQKVAVTLQPIGRMARYPRKLKVISADAMKQGTSKQSSTARSNVPKGPAPDKNKTGDTKPKPPATKGKGEPKPPKPYGKTMGPEKGGKHDGSVSAPAWMNVVAYKDCFEAVINKGGKMTELCTPIELTNLRDLFCSLVPRKEVDGQPTGRQFVEHLDNKVFTPFTLLFERNSVEEYSGLWTETTFFAEDLLKEAAKVFGHEPQFCLEEDWNRIESGVMRNIQALKLPQKASKPKESSDSGVITISEGRGIDGGLRRKWVDGLRDDPRQESKGKEEISRPGDEAKPEPEK
ncbi:hypothetical protein FHL15_010363 [Xylaria flabelliformis]|uniref:Uncharacterized protein n=1 Tax=Xylaria flabelliformis TaxID=2512241 RepID=A0A553HLH0_9PEZI|nr:hypothetical protein FHL15_010363 [Xylaria flabelliformis]